MRDDIRQAIEAGAGVTFGGEPQGLIGRAKRFISPRRLRLQLAAVLQELPDEMTVAELRDEVQGAADDDADSET
jgi:hypothetical protein